jgi:hypothetical protein
VVRKFDSALEARIAGDLKQGGEEGQWTEKRVLNASISLDRGRDRRGSR